MPSSLDRLAQQVADDALRVAERATAHRPAGSPQGGQFAPGKGSGGPGNAHLGPSNADKVKNAATMFGTGSPQHVKAQKQFGGKTDTRPPGDAADKSKSGGPGKIPKNQPRGMPAGTRVTRDNVGHLIPGNKLGFGNKPEFEVTKSVHAKKGFIGNRAITLKGVGANAKTHPEKDYSIGVAFGYSVVR